MIEYTVAGCDAPELFCLITDLHDHAAYPARLLARAYHWRWIGPGTCLKEAKSAITGAGPSTGPMLRSASPALVRQEHAAWVTAREISFTAARRAVGRAGPPPRPGRPAPAPRPQDQGPAGLPGRKAAPGHPHRASRDQRLPAPRRLTPVTPADPWNRPPPPARQSGALHCPPLSVKPQRDHDDHKLTCRRLPTTLN